MRWSVLRGEPSCDARAGRRLAVRAVVAAALAASAAAARPATGDPATAPDIVEAARGEGRVVVHATTDRAAAAPLLADFAALHPEIAVEYLELPSSELYERIARGRGPQPDVAWSSAMDLQMKLANDGYADRYASPEARRVPTWAVWKDEAFGTTFEPVGFAYDRRALAPGDVPGSHAALAALLRGAPDRWRGRVAAYDPQRSGIGFLLATQDARTDPAFAEAVRAYGAAGVRLYGTSGEILDRIAAGEHALGVNVIASYALDPRRAEVVGMIYPRDYTLVLSRIALVLRAAPHPNAARVFLDYLLSRRGQQVLARSSLFAIRSDVEGDATASALGRLLGRSLRPIPVGTGLLVFLDDATRAEFLRRWRDAAAPRP
jgi:iron(III) transport system substrate-binding protein